MNVLDELRGRFRSALAELCADPAPYALMVKPAQDARFGDYQANCAMTLAKERGEKPQETAQRIVAALRVGDLCDPPQTAGPGFINLRLKDGWLREQAQGLIADSRLGVVPAAAPRTIVIDYSSPNVAKPMHVGHIRSTVIGDALYRILTFCGHRVTGDNHIGDWGTQFGMIIYGYKHFLDAEAYARNAVGELSRLYRLVNQLSDYQEAVKLLAPTPGLPEIEKRRLRAEAELNELERAAAQSNAEEKKAIERRSKQARQQLDEVKAEKNELARKRDRASDDLKLIAAENADVAERARAETAKLHAGDAENRRLWEEFIPKCLEEINAIYGRLGVRFDLTLGESFYDPMLSEVVQNLLDKGIAEHSMGAVCVFPGVTADRNMPFIVRKSDGAYTYATTDLATIRYRAETLYADTMLYVVDARQGDHFKLLFETARRWGYGRIDFRHVSFGTILGEDKRPFRTRAGGNVALGSLLDEAIVRARAIVDAGDDAKPGGAELDDDARARIAQVVGIGAIKYADLSQNRETDYVFSWDKMLATTGDTATYVQYAYARVCGIFRKGSVDREALRRGGGKIVLEAPAERALALQLVRFPEALEQSALEHRPNFLTQYLFETANCFSTFFEQCPVLKAESESLRTSRLLLADLTARTLAQGLELLGIGTVEKM